MTRLRVGMPVYHFMQMGKIGVIIAIENAANAQMQYSTNGVPSLTKKARVRYPDGSEVLHSLADLMRADLD